MRGGKEESPGCERCHAVGDRSLELGLGHRRECCHLLDWLYVIPMSTSFRGSGASSSDALPSREDVAVPRSVPGSRAPCAFAISAISSPARRSAREANLSSCALGFLFGESRTPTYKPYQAK